MEKSFDPNIPDMTNGDYFCRLCLSHSNSEYMWKSHIVGKRHIKNVVKYPNGLSQREIKDSKEDSLEKPAKYGRFDDWDEYPSKDETGYYSSRNYVPKIRPQVIDYDHKKSLPDVISSPVSKTFDAFEKENEDVIFVEEKFPEVKKSFEEKSSKKQADGMQQNKWNKVKPCREKSLYDDEFERELDELLNNSSDYPDSDRNAFSNDKLKRNSDNLFSGKFSKRESKERGLETTSTVDSARFSQKKWNEIKIPDDSFSLNKRDDKNKMKMDSDLYKKKSSKKDDEDFLDVFHKMNDRKLFQMSAADEPEDNSSVKKSSKIDYSKLDDLDPDKLTPDLLDNLLSSYMKPKADSSKGKESTEMCAKNSAGTNTKDDLDIFTGKLESLPTKTFFQIILAVLKKIDLKDSDELKMLLDVIAQAQDVVCKKLPPSLQAVIKSKVSQSNSKTTSVHTQNPIFPQSNSAPTSLPIVSQTVSHPVFPTISQPDTKSGQQPLFQEGVTSVSYPVSHVPHQSSQTPVSSTAPLIRPPFLNNSNSYQSMDASQNYPSSVGTASKKFEFKSLDSVQATIAYQNYLSSLQAKAEEESKTVSKSTEAPHSISKYKTSSPGYRATHIVSVSGSGYSHTSHSVQSKHTLPNFFSTMQSASSRTQTKSALKRYS